MATISSKKSSFGMSVFADLEVATDEDDVDKINAKSNENKQPYLKIFIAFLLLISLVLLGLKKFDLFENFNLFESFSGGKNNFTNNKKYYKKLKKYYNNYITRCS